MTNIATMSPRPVGRPCAVCAMPAHERVHLEVSLARGITISRLSRQMNAPGRDSIRHHVAAGHLPAELEDEILRATGLDSTTIIARIHDIAQRARETAMEARERSNFAAVLRAGDSELRALTALSALGADSEPEIELDRDAQAVTRATLSAAKRDPRTADAIAAELADMGFVTLAEEIQNVNSRNELNR